jgi:formamidopyrimidine-DNA glycosylase
MPELPEVEIVRRGLEAAMLGPGRGIRQLALNREGLRYPFTPGMAAALAGREVSSLSRRGKYILMQMRGAGTLVWHLGMSGSIRVFPKGEAYAPALHDHAVFGLEDGGTVAFNDPRRFGFLLHYKDERWREAEPFASMGPEPLGNDFNGPVLAARLKGRKSPIKTALLDQRVVAGLGNIYVCEALYQARISPLRRAGDVKEPEAEDLSAAIRDVLGRALEAGGSSLRDYRHTDGGLGCFQHRFSVYDREGQPCPVCGKGCEVKRIVQAGRSTFYCPAVQH